MENICSGLTDIREQRHHIAVNHTTAKKVDIVSCSENSEIIQTLIQYLVALIKNMYIFTLLYYSLQRQYPLSGDIKK